DTVITVHNSGTIELTLTSSGILGSGFNIIEPATFPVTIPVDGEIELHVRFRPPGQAGQYDAKLWFAAQPCDLTDTLELTGQRPVESPLVADAEVLDFERLFGCPGQA